MTRRSFSIGLSSAASSQTSFAAEAGTGFTSGGHTIAVEWFPNSGRAAGAKAPAILLLHGADGLSFADSYRLAANMLAGAGYHVAFPHYLDRTGDRRVAYSRLRQYFPLWLDTVRDGLVWLAARADVDPERLGLVGISLGAALALALDDRRVRAIVDYSGPVAEVLHERRPALPPTLILHGEDDPVVPVSHARRLERLLVETGTPHETHIYPGQGHAFSGPARLDAASRAAAFLDRYLKSD